MAKPCGVCIHPSRLSIEQAILNRKPLRRIATDFGFTYTRGQDGQEVGDHKIIQRHRDTCMPEAYAQAVAEGEVESGVALHARMRELEDHVDHVLQRALKGEPVMVGDVPLLDDEGHQVMRFDLRLLLAAVREARANVETLASLQGKVETNPADLDKVRRHLDSPEARRLLARLDELAAQAENHSAEQGG